jgi:Rrf2 family protein
MIEIASPSNTSGILQKDIANKQDIPLNYLDIIISGLRNAGLIVNYGGKSSGYILTKKTDQISIYDVYRAFEPELELVNCNGPTNSCMRLDICPVTDYWSDLNTKIKSMMKGATIDMLVRQNEVSEPIKNSN